MFIVASVAGVYIYQGANPGPSCKDPLGTARVLRTQLAAPTTLDGVTEFALPSPVRQPSSPVVAPDGSVWFAEQSVAGIAHLFPANRTLVEYAWPFAYSTPPFTGELCGQKTNVWGLALWNGKVWATDPEGNQLVAMDPSTARFTQVQIPSSSSFPYTLTPGPNDTLWFTELFTGKVGVLDSSGTIQEHQLPGGAISEPAQVVFANSTAGFVVDVGASEPKGGGVYSFNVDGWSPKLLGGQRLLDPTSISLGSGSIWVALHGSSSVASYNFTSDEWSYFPTSYVDWNGNATTTLPYFVDSSGSQVWVNEHYGNRMALINPGSGSMVEYSEADHPVDGNTIGNAVTFGLGDGRAWFAEETGNIIGYADSSYSPGYTTSVSGNATLVMRSGTTSTVRLVIHDTTYRGRLNLTFADSESFISKPANLTFTAGSIPASLQQGDTQVPINITATQSLKPGTYYAILTATDGLTYESSFVKVIVPG
jgi:streptogramin lyase